eukprot:scaffold2941_cov149-Ochromonas_danica.AAC.1
MEVNGRSEDWAIYLSETLRNRQYKKVTLTLREDYNYRVGNLKSILEPYYIELDASTTSESSLISILQDLPHLNSVHLVPNVNCQYTDATLAAISEHANNLMVLDLFNINFSDKQLSELIMTCQLLKSVTSYVCGWESLVAISQHYSNLNWISLRMAESVSDEMLEGLLLDKKVAWPSTLKKGYIHAYLYRVSFWFNKSHQWIRRSARSVYDDHHLFQNKNKKIEDRTEAAV